MSDFEFTGFPADALRFLRALRRNNEQDRDFKNMRTPDQEAFLWIRILNWYGERTKRPRPGRRLAVA